MALCFFRFFTNISSLGISKKFPKSNLPSQTYFLFRYKAIAFCIIDLMQFMHRCASKQIYYLCKNLKIWHSYLNNYRYGTLLRNLQYGELISQLYEHMLKRSECNSFLLHFPLMELCVYLSEREVLLPCLCCNAQEGWAGPVFCLQVFRLETLGDRVIPDENILLLTMLGSDGLGEPGYTNVADSIYPCHRTACGAQISSKLLPHYKLFHFP